MPLASPSTWAVPVTAVCTGRTSHLFFVRSTFVPTFFRETLVTLEAIFWRWFWRWYCGLIAQVTTAAVKLALGDIC